MNKERWYTDNPLQCPIVGTINIVGGKWKPMILHMLSDRIMRFGELKKQLPSISQKMLTQQLRELELDGIVGRTVYPEVPPRVEYRLTGLGSTLIPVLDQLYAWGTHFAQAQAQAGIKNLIELPDDLGQEGVSK